MKYKDQGKAFLNAYWEEAEKDAENVWKWAHQFQELDIDKGEDGNDLDEFNAHRFLEKLGETKTVKELRENLSKADLDFNKRLALIEYCLFRYDKKIEDFLKRPQSSSPDAAREIENCQKLLESAQKSLVNAQEKAKQAALSEKQAIQAEKEQKEALAEVKAQEDAYNQKTEELKKKSETGGVVAKNRAKAELAQHLAEDPLPLSRAKITCEAATKKAEKSRKQAEESRKVADDAVVTANEKVAEAEEALQAAKANATAGMGNIWWMERELEEAKKYMPQKRGGVAK